MYKKLGVLFLFLFTLNFSYSSEGELSFKNESDKEFLDRLQLGYEGADLPNGKDLSLTELNLFHVIRICSIDKVLSKRKKLMAISLDKGYYGPLANPSDALSYQVFYYSGKVISEEDIKSYKESINIKEKASIEENSYIYELKEEKESISLRYNINTNLYFIKNIVYGKDQYCYGYAWKL